MHLKMNLIYDAFLKYHNLALFRIFLMQINDVARNWACKIVTVYVNEIYSVECPIPNNTDKSFVW